MSVDQVSTQSAAEAPRPGPRDYSLMGPEAAAAIAGGLADAEWYRPPIDADRLRILMERTDGRAARDTALWFFLLVATGTLAFISLGTWYAIPAFAAFGALYGGSADARWHENGHGTAFRTKWANDVVYNIASFMLLREPTLWRWSHFRHHSDTIIVGRDAEIGFPRPTPRWKVIVAYLNLIKGPQMVWVTAQHAVGRVDGTTAELVPEEDFRRLKWEARAFIAVLVGVIAWAIASGSIVPLLFVGLPVVLRRVVGGVLRPNSARRSPRGRPRPSPEHPDGVHQPGFSFPLPQHELPRGAPHVPDGALLQPPGPPSRDKGVPAPAQAVDVRGVPRALPRFATTTARPGVGAPRPRSPRRSLCTQGPISWTSGDGGATGAQGLSPDDGGVVGVSPAGAGDGTARAGTDLGPVSSLAVGEVRRIDHGGNTYALYRLGENEFALTDGLCTHAQTHLADGHLEGGIIECPKHNGRFDVRTGEAVRRPPRLPLCTYAVQVSGSRVIGYLGPATLAAAIVEAASSSPQEATHSLTL